MKGFCHDRSGIARAAVQNKRERVHHLITEKYFFLRKDLDWIGFYFILKSTVNMQDNNVLKEFYMILLYKSKCLYIKFFCEDTKNNLT